MVTAAGFLFAHKVSSIESFVAKFGWDLNEHLGRAVERGESLAWVNGHIVTLVGDKAAALRNAEKARRNREAATVLKNGDLVEIEGRRYTVRIVETDISSLEASNTTIRVSKHRYDIPSLEGFGKLMLRISNRRTDQHCDPTYA
ncbi:hypothetical protein [Bradyrhizobium sp. AZCC 2289]|uniref:hypothetical protein n=1 Tax=Bradyrhizobium sp. AZCC 2289 TaxID=3117026 RepID=UPI002FF074D7